MCVLRNKAWYKIILDLVIGSLNNTNKFINSMPMPHPITWANEWLVECACAASISVACEPRTSSGRKRRARPQRAARQILSPPNTIPAPICQCIKLIKYFVINFEENIDFFLLNTYVQYLIWYFVTTLSRLRLKHFALVKGPKESDFYNKLEEPASVKKKGADRSEKIII